MLFFVLNVILDASFFDNALLYILAASSGPAIPEHGFSWHGDREGGISFPGRIVVEQFVVEKSTLSTLVQSIYAQSSYH